MLAPLRRTLRERLDRRSVAGALLFTAVLAWLFDQSLGNAVASLGAAALVGGAGLVADAYDLRDEVRGLGFGLWMAVAGCALAALGGSTTAAGTGALFALGGAWVTLDSVQTLRHDGVAATDPASADGDEVYRQYLARRVRVMLRERPLTRRELREEFEETPDAVDDALALLQARDLVEREGSAFRARDPPDRGPVRRGLVRLARPVTLELGDDPDPADGGRAPDGRPDERSDRGRSLGSEAE